MISALATIACYLVFSGIGLLLALGALEAGDWLSGRDYLASLRRKK